jgi:hypothetical protein
MKSELISTKLRITKPLDWATPLKTYLKALYGTSLDLSEQISRFATLRACVTHDAENLIVLKDMYYKYYGQLELLDLRLPIGDGVRVKFTWYDSYNTSESHSQHSLAFEKASVLYNLGSILSQLGVLKFKEEDYKLSYQYFQYAAGVYKFISENFLHAPSEDLSAKTMGFLLALELAQAQEVFLLKVLYEDGKASLISRMAHSCSIHYELAADKYDLLDDFGDSKWEKNLGFKHKFYKGLALYEHALGIEEKKIGEAIVSIKMALETWSDCHTYDSIGIDLKSYVTLAEEKLTTLNKENDLIYHDLLCSKETIELKPLDAAKAISLNDQKIEDVIGEDIFEQVIPMNVHEKLSFYSEEKAKILREQIEKNETCDIELSSFLEYLKLPQSLQEFKNSVENKLDDRLVSWSQYISGSKYSNADQNKHKIMMKRDAIMNLIKQLESKLQDEPDSASSGLKDELINAKQSSLSASTLDEQIYATIEPELNNLQTLRSTSTLESALFNNNEMSLLDMNDTDGSNIKQYISKIESNLRVLNAMKSERSKVIDDLKKSIHEDDISNILILNNKKLSDKEEKKLFEQELTKFEPLTNRHDSIIFKQPQLIKDIKTNYDAIISSNSGVSDKARKILSFEKSYLSFKEYEMNFQKSIDFYDNLLQFVREVEVNVNRFLDDKASQRQRSTQSSNDLLRDRFNKLSVSSQSPRGSFTEPAIVPQGSDYGNAAPSFNPGRAPQVSYQEPVSYQPMPYQQQQQQQQRPLYQQPLAPSYARELSESTPVQPSYSSYDRPPQQQPSQPQGYQYQPQVSNYPVDRPPLPPKAQQSYQPSSTYQSSVLQPSYQIAQAQGQQGAHDNRFPFYNTPSTFNSGMYDQFGKSASAPSNSNPGPGYTKPYDPTQPYP